MLPNQPTQADPSDRSDRSDPAAPRTVTLRLGAAECELRIIDSSDDSREARILAHEIAYHTQWIERVSLQYWVMSPSRRERLELVGVEVLALLLQARCGLPAAAVQDLCNRIGLVFERLLPAEPGDAFPEVPNGKVFENLGRVAELRHQAAGKLLAELLVDRNQAQKENLDRILDHLRDPVQIMHVLDAVTG